MDSGLAHLHYKCPYSVHALHSPIRLSSQPSWSLIKRGKVFSFLMELQRKAANEGLMNGLIVLLFV